MTNKKKLEDRADEALRQYVRARDIEGDTFKCFVCHQILRKEYSSVGHFRKRRHESTRYYPRNCHLICSDCQDEGKHDNDEKYAIRIDLKYGPGTADTLTQLSHTTANYSIPELLDIIDGLTKLKDEINKDKKWY